MFRKLREIRKSEYAKNTSILMIGTVLSLVIQLAATPILSRLYGATEIGIFQIFTSWFSVLVIVATGRYELGIMLPKDDEDAFGIAILSSLMSIIFMIFLFLVLFIYYNVIGPIDKWVWCLPGAVGILGVYYSCNYLLNRKKMYKNLAVNRIIQAVGVAGLSVLFAFVLSKELKDLGLIFAYLAAQGLVMLLLIIYTSIEYVKTNVNVTLKQMIMLARRYKRFFLFSMPSGVINTYANQVPVFLLGYLWNSAVVGQYSMMVRILALPIVVLGQAIGDVFRQRASKEYAENKSCLSVYKKTVKSLAFVAIIPFLFFAIFSRTVFVWFFGSQWDMAAMLIAIMSPFYYIKLVISPLTFMTIIAERQRFEMIWQIMLLIFTTGGMYITFLMGGNIYEVLIVFGVIMSLMYFAHMTFTYHLAKGVI